MKKLLRALALLLLPTILAAQTPAMPGAPLSRRYRVGETIKYHMNATNDDLRYSADVSCVTKKNADDVIVEVCGWSALTRNGQPITLTPEAAQFRQVVSLDPRWTPSGPESAKADPRLQGPILDFFTFYIDLWFANKIGALRHPGDHFYMPMPQQGSWADGAHVLIGKDQVDFDLNLQSIDAAKQAAVLIVHHVPPPHPNLDFPAVWMQSPTADTPNNWIQVEKRQDGKFTAGAGKEIFDDSITVSTEDGRILSATMDNPVVTSSRVCDDAALNKCGEPQPHTIHRSVEIAMER